MTNIISTLRQRRAPRAILTSGLLALGVAMVAPAAAHADSVTPPAVPGILTVPAGHKPFAEGYATGTQNYQCRLEAGQYTWAFTGPVATLQTNHGAIQHFLSANPDEGGTARATWQAADGSTIWAKKAQESPVSGAIPWLLLTVVGDAGGSDGGDRLSQASYIHRVNTTGGQAPTSGCDAMTVGATQNVPYTADYVFYKDASQD